ncbi:MAG: flippase-like domain-containing protein [Gemmatimonadota bacterium]|nr:flippase-like domain-containing protein [Gemmatimonadota bacterium]HEU4989765.1 lysylphosphatidylglycerol synthase domain-containing protein [Gemmatimonadaceae bacterium]
MARRGWLRGARLAVSAVALVYIGWALKHYWTAYESQPLEPHLRWPLILASGGVVLATYAVLVQTWRVMLVEWDARLSFWRAAHIWSVANLYRYVPGKVWQIGAMGMMAQREGVSPVAATGSAVLNTVVNVATGFAVALGTGSVALDAYHPGAGRVAAVLTVAAFAGLVSLPLAMPRVLAFLRRATGRAIPEASIPPRVIAYAIAGNLVSWVLYGMALQLLVAGVLGHAAGALPSYIAVYSASYVLGYIVLFLPAGIGARDGAMAAALPAFKLMTGPQAVLIAVASRLWTSILELVPGFLFLAADAWRRRSA